MKKKRLLSIRLVTPYKFTRKRKKKKKPYSKLFYL